MRKKPEGDGKNEKHRRLAVRNQRILTGRLYGFFD